MRVMTVLGHVYFNCITLHSYFFGFSLAALLRDIIILVLVCFGNPLLDLIIEGSELVEKYSLQPNTAQVRKNCQKQLVGFLC